MLVNCNIELKNINVHLGLSQETYAYTASVYLNDKKVGTVRNEGHGGPDHFDGPLEVFRQMNDWCKANLPAEETDMPDPNDPDKMWTYQPDFESFCQAKVEVHLLQKEVKGHMRNKILWRQEGDTGLRTMVYRRNKKMVPITDEVIAKFRETYPDAMVLNEMPIDKACEVYLANVS